VALAGETSRVTVTPGAALAGSQPQVLTIILRDQPDVRPARAAATLFLAPSGGRVGDSALFEAYRLGRSPEAFEALVQRHGPAVARASQRIVGNRADAEDVTQFVFLRLARWQGRFPGTLTGWLRTVSRNASLTLLRSRRRRRRYEREAAKPASVEQSDATGLDESLDAAIRQLPAPLEAAVRLRYLEGHSQQEAAQLVGCPRGTLSRRAAHGVRVLRELLGGDRAITG
jgi:RNA polymerase sigma factor (sigma-70 family)